ncbi:MAG: OmpA family protein, partial [Mesorhizobium sp.]
VMDYLAAGGIDRNRMWAKGYGKDRLVRDCPDTACRSQNRRVVSNLRDERDEP